MNNNQNYPMAGFNNGGYQPVTQPIMPMPATSPVQMPATNRGITSVAEVSGEDGMSNYPVAAGTSAILIDFGIKTFWIKSRDAWGVPMVPRKFVFDELVPQPQQNPGAVQMPNNQQQQVPAQGQNNGVSREEFNEMKEMLTKMYNELSGTSN